MTRSTAWVVVIIAVVAIAAATLFMHFRHQQNVEAPPPPPVVQQPPASSAPTIKYPIAEAKTEQEPAPPPLPPLDSSDATVKQALEGVLGNNTVAEFIDTHGFIQRFAATVDALPRNKVARQTIPLKAIPGTFAVSGTGDDLFIDRANERRYAVLVHLAGAVDTRKLVAAYVHLYPLFQEAYRKLGYPSDYFNDRLIESIDELLDAPEIDGPIKLVRPKVLYQYADPDLEGRSCGQKMMIRMGLQNEREIKAKLKQLRQELTGQGLH